MILHFVCFLQNIHPWNAYYSGWIYCVLCVFLIMQMQLLMMANISNTYNYHLGEKRAQ